jgi:GNAT superfamily N-acetyltransferase
MTALLHNYYAKEKLLNGREITLRAIRPDDKHALQDVMHHLSAKSRYYRFFTPKEELTDKELAFFTELDFERHVALLACVHENGEEVPVGVGRYILPDEDDPPLAAEVSCAVEEDYQGIGIGTHLLHHLTEIARQHGILEFYAYTLSENEKMLELFANSGLLMSQSYDHSGVVKVRMLLS